jgi:hypothetical protein
MKHAAQNKDCPIDAGTKECFDVKWPHEEFDDDAPWQHCGWWDAMYAPDDEEPTVTVVDTEGTFNATLEDILRLLGRGGDVE